MVGQCAGNNREEEVGVPCQGGVSGGSSNVRNMTCGRDGECFGDNAHREHFNLSLSHAREKNCACECVRGEVYCLHFLAVVFALSSDLVLAFALARLAFALAFVLFSFPLARAGLAFAFVRPCQTSHLFGCFASIRFSFDSPSPYARKLAHHEQFPWKLLILGAHRQQIHRHKLRVSSS